MYEMLYINSEHEYYPHRLKMLHNPDKLPIISAIGNVTILNKEMIAVFCSIKCPGNIIIQLYDLMKSWANKEIVIMGGFHSPLEKECLRLLLKGTAPIILCPARSIENMKIKSEYHQPLTDGRLLIVSPFIPKTSRITADTAKYRNNFLSYVSNSIFIAYAEPNGKVEQFCLDLVNTNKAVFTFNSSSTANLISIGAKLLPINLQ